MEHWTTKLKLMTSSFTTPDYLLPSIMLWTSGKRSQKKIVSWQVQGKIWTLIRSSRLWKIINRWNELSRLRKTNGQLYRYIVDSKRMNYYQPNIKRSALLLSLPSKYWMLPACRMTSIWILWTGQSKMCLLLDLGHAFIFGRRLTVKSLN